MSKLSRLGSNAATLSDPRIEPIIVPAKVKKAFPEMQQFEADINHRLQDIQRALTDVILAVRLKN